MAAAAYAAAPSTEKSSEPTGLDLGPGGVPLHASRIASQVEELRDLRFHDVPRVGVVSPDQLTEVGQDLGRPRTSAQRRRDRAIIGVDQLAGTLPQRPASELTRSGSAEQIGGAYDYAHNRVLLVEGSIANRTELRLVLAHELTHALEDQHFALHLGTLTEPSPAAQTRRALVEGTATYVGGLYLRRYLGDQLPIRQRLEGHESLLASASTAWAIKAETIFEYVNGPIFVYRVFQRGDGWRSVNEALRRPPTQSTQILHPEGWRGQRRSGPIELGTSELLRGDWHLVGAGSAGEEDGLAILGVGAPESQERAAMNGWGGGRFELWRQRGATADCGESCSEDETGVIGFHWRGPGDLHDFSSAFFSYALLGRIGTRIGAHTWRALSGGYAALRAARRSSAIAFAPTPRLAGQVAQRAARGIATSAD